MTQPDDIPPWKQRNLLKPSRVDVVDPWNPWQTLVEDYPDWELVTKHRLEDTVWGLTSQPRKIIWLCSSLGPIEKTSTLAHELVHIELGIWNGYGAHRSADYAPQERTVIEVTARRLIPFRHLARVIADRPNALFRYWAALLNVETIVLSDRLITLNPVERAALNQLRGGSLPTMPYSSLFDADDLDEVA